jgi:hypothetical protein
VNSQANFWYIFLNGGELKSSNDINPMARVLVERFVNMLTNVLIASGGIQAVLSLITRELVGEFGSYAKRSLKDYSKL